MLLIKTNIVFLYGLFLCILLVVNLICVVYAVTLSVKLYVCQDDMANDIRSCLFYIYNLSIIYIFYFKLIKKYNNFNSLTVLFKVFY